MDDRKEFKVEDAILVFRNFAGKEGPMNREGDRNFCVLLDHETAELMAKDGWNIKALNSREEGEPDQPYIQVAVSFKVRPPKIVMISSSGRTHLNQNTVEMLDYADIKTVDLIANEYQWNVNGKTGIKAYLKTMFVTIDEDELERKYAVREEE